MYREDLRQYPRNGWALFGLEQSLKAQQRDAEAAEIDRQLIQAWARADIRLTDSRF
jgi:hypothetical protein